MTKYMSTPLARLIEQWRKTADDSFQESPVYVATLRCCADALEAALRDSESASQGQLAIAARLVLTALEKADIAGDTLIWWEERELLRTALDATRVLVREPQP